MHQSKSIWFKARFIKGHNSRIKDHGKKCKASRLETERLKNIIKMCGCGCGAELKNKKNRFISGHNQSWLGKHLSEDHKSKIAKFRIGREIPEDTRLKISLSNTGKKRSEETLAKMRSWKRSPETKLKMSIAGGNQLGKRLPPETRKKQSISAIKRVNRQLENGQKAIPCYGSNEKLIFDILEKELYISSEEALRNDEELFFLIGKWCDYFLVKYNVDIEVLEEHHFDKITGELSQYDLDRQILLAHELSCMIYYIREQEFLKNPKKEIQRLQDFLMLLKDGRN